jgi:hypothetical protein
MSGRFPCDNLPRHTALTRISVSMSLNEPDTRSEGPVLSHTELANLAAHGSTDHKVSKRSDSAFGSLTPWNSGLAA